MSKIFRSLYFRKNEWVRQMRRSMGPEVFDAQYRALYKFLASLAPGQYFHISDLCRKNPDNHFVVRKMCELYYHMDFFVNMEFDTKTDKVTILPPLYGYDGVYSPPDVYTKIVKDPKAWGVKPEHLF